MFGLAAAKSSGRRGFQQNHALEAYHWIYKVFLNCTVFT